MNDASATLAGVAADMRAGQAQMLAQELHQQRTVLDLAGFGLAVHRDGYGWHSSSSLILTAPRRHDRRSFVRGGALVKRPADLSLTA